MMRTAKVNTQKDNIVSFEKTHLPEDKSQALRMLIKLSEQLLDLAEKETQILVQNDMGSFAVLQSEKETASSRYAEAAKEFHARLDEFRGADIGLLDRLEELQHALRDKTVSNNKIVEKMFKRSQDKVHDSLLNVQELAQKDLSLKTPNNAVDNEDEGQS